MHVCKCCVCSFAGSKRSMLSFALVLLLSPIYCCGHRLRFWAAERKPEPRGSRGAWTNLCYRRGWSPGASAERRTAASTANNAQRAERRACDAPGDAHRCAYGREQVVISVQMLNGWRLIRLYRLHVAITWDHVNNWIIACRYYYCCCCCDYFSDSRAFMQYPFLTRVCCYWVVWSALYSAPIASQWRWMGEWKKCSHACRSGRIHSLQSRSQTFCSDRSTTNQPSLLLPKSYCRDIYTLPRVFGFVVNSFLLLFLSVPPLFLREDAVLLSAVGLRGREDKASSVLWS